MKKFILKVLLYLMPAIIIVVSIAITDPYYLFHDNSTFDQEKFEIGYSFDQGRRYKINTYWNRPTNKIILGASEINIINERNIPEKGWHSLSYGGAPLQESLQMYWEVSKDHRLSKVIIAPEFIKYYNAISTATGDPYYANFNWETSQSAKALSIYSNKLDYFIDKYTLKSTWQCISGKIIPTATRSKPKASKEDFWQHQINYAKESYSGFLLKEKRDEIISLFKEIKQDADTKGVDVIVVIPIQHIDLLKEEFKGPTCEVYYDYIQTLAEIFNGIYYLAYIDSVSNKEDLFSDPFHCTTEKPYIEALFGKSRIKIISAKEVPEYLESIKTKIFSDE